MIRDLDRREKIAAAKRGKPRPAHVRKVIGAAQRGRSLSEQTRRKMSAAYKARGTLVPGTRLWTAEEDEVVRALPCGEAARRTGRTLWAVRWRRRLLALPDGRRKGR
jgi:hypothetical protein